MKNGITELVFIIDRSGSMHGLEGDTIGGFNSLIEKQRRKDGACYVSCVLFNHESRVVYDRVKLDKVREMTGEDYVTDGSTALVDAIGCAIHHIGNVHKYARPEDVPENTMFVVITDGMENASRLYNADEVRAMVKREQEEYGWEFLFIGANIDSVQTAKRFGIRPDNAVDYHSDGMGTRAAYEAMEKAVTNVRASRPLGDAWKNAIRRDNARRER